MTIPPESPANETPETPKIPETSKEARLPEIIEHKKITPELQQQISKFEAGAILLFDEADSLFGKRSEVGDDTGGKPGHNRYGSTNDQDPGKP